MPTVLLLALACQGAADTPTPPPFGVQLPDDDRLRAGAARVDITPTGFETWTDLDGDATFDGCINAPAADRPGCVEPFDDADGDGHFDAAYIAGFGSPRPALGVHDPLTVTAMVVARGTSYVAIVGVDAIGILENRIADTRTLLAADGFDGSRLVVSASHTHEGVDTIGIWGNAESLVPGTWEPTVEELPGAVRDAVAAAFEGLEPVSARQGTSRMRDLDPALSGAPFGGTNPDPRIEGGMNDIRDPIVAADTVLAVALERPDGSRVATLVNASGHPEVVGAANTLLSADYVHWLREHLERTRGGLVVFTSGALGGMQSASGAPIPDVDETGAIVRDSSGAPRFLREEGFDAARAWGILVARAAEAALTDSQPWEALRVRSHELLVPVDNLSFRIAFQVGLLDTPMERIVQDARCPGWGDPDVLGCVPTGVWVVELGATTLATIPGELFPELFWGVPDEPAMDDAALRPDDRRWPQADPTCASVDYDSACRDRDTVTVQGVTCDCLRHHATPYVLSEDSAPPLDARLPGRFRAPVGIANGYCGYVVPEPDFSTYASVLGDNGDHYEETNACSRWFAPLLFDAYDALLAGG